MDTTAPKLKGKRNKHFHKARITGNPLSSRREDQAAELTNDVIITAVILLCGAPPPIPVAQKDSATESLMEFGGHIHDLGLWTAEAKRELFRIWQVTDTDYGESVVLRRAFDMFLEKAYNLKREDY